MRPRIRILLPFDFSTSARAAVREARVIGKATDAEVELLYVFPEDMEPASERHYTSQVTEKLLEKEAARLRIDGIPSSVFIAEGDPAKTILDMIAERSPDLVLMGSHTRKGLARIFLGSVAQSVVRDAPCPVVVCRVARREAQSAAEMPKIVVGVDFDHPSIAAVADAGRIAARIGASVRLIHAISIVPRIPLEEIARLETRLAALEAELMGYGVRETSSAVLIGDPVKVLIAEASDSRGWSAIAVGGRRHRGPISELVLGSVTRQLLHKTTLPVLVTHTPGSPADRRPTLESERKPSFLL